MTQAKAHGEAEAAGRTQVTWQAWEVRAWPKSKWQTRPLSPDELEEGDGERPCVHASKAFPALSIASSGQIPRPALWYILTSFEQN